LESVGDGLLVMDESYVNFVPTAWPAVPLLESGSLFLLRSMTKDYALGGLRLGYGLGPRGVMEALRQARPPWSVNSLAQAAGLAALKDQGHLERSLRGVEESKTYLVAEMSAPSTGSGQRLGFKVLPSAAHFFLIKVGDAPGFRSRLLRRGFCLRDCSSFGLPRFVRLAPRTLPECQRLVEALRELAPWTSRGRADGSPPTMP
ncbi:MAG: aminotransferase class I/II-fold pyridoxal phosphate-dependent enzyme, partial [Chloroflexota bacterium]|nr:aminotransferase class I/II-fold pyridoxal phosphate-dependent enzyme [Chloroflexota bacterium]